MTMRVVPASVVPTRRVADLIAQVVAEELRIRPADRVYSRALAQRIWDEYRDDLTVDWDEYVVSSLDASIQRHVLSALASTRRLPNPRPSAPKRLSKSKLRQYLRQREAKWAEALARWREHVGTYHVPLLEMTRNELAVAIYERTQRAEREQLVVRFLKALLEAMPPEAERVRDLGQRRVLRIAVDAGIVQDPLLPEALDLPEENA
jgi:hypothetical protein